MQASVIPLNAVFLGILAKARERTLKFTDQRVKLTNEVLQVRCDIWIYPINILYDICILYCLLHVCCCFALALRAHSQVYEPARETDQRGLAGGCNAWKDLVCVHVSVFPRV